MVRTYNEYLKLLETAVIGNGKKALSDYQVGQFIKNNNLDSDWNIVASEVKKDMVPIVKKFEPEKAVVTSNSKPTLKSSGTRGKAKKVKGYSEYLRLLENAVIQNGKKELQISQIDDFIRVNDLNLDWGIVLSEVKKDMVSILNKYRGSVNSQPKPSVQLKSSNVGRNIGRNTYSVGKQVKSYDVYMHLLEDAMQKNANAELSESQILHFISANKLDSDWGITSVEIHKDMKMILAKFARYDRAVALRTKHAGIQSGVVSCQKTADVHSNIQNNEKKKSGLTEEDKRVILVLRDMLRKYPNIVENNRRLKAAIADILPGRRRKVNLLGMLAEENIVRAIETKNSLDQVLCDRFASVLEEEYGTSMELARRMVLIWFHAYGRLILNKNID